MKIKEEKNKNKCVRQKKVYLVHCNSKESCTFAPPLRVSGTFQTY